MLIHYFNLVLARTETLKIVVALGILWEWNIVHSSFFISVARIVEIIASATGFPWHGGCTFLAHGPRGPFVGQAVSRWHARLRATAVAPLARRGPGTNHHIIQKLQSTQSEKKNRNLETLALLWFRVRQNSGKLGKFGKRRKLRVLVPGAKPFAPQSA